MKKLIKIYLIAAIAIGTIFLQENTYAIQEVYKKQDRQQIVNIGILYDGDSYLNEKRFNDIRSELDSLLSPGYDLRYENILTADWKQESIAENAEKMLHDQEVDMVIPLGYLSASYINSLENIAKPVVMPFVFNKTAVSKITEDLQVFHKLVGYKKLTVVGNKDLITGELEDGLKEQFAKINYIKYSGDVDELINAVSPDAGAVYMLPLLNTDEQGFEKFVSHLVSQKLPSFSYSGKQEVLKGVLASYRYTEDSSKPARQVAVAVQDVLLGETPSGSSSGYIPESSLVINMETAGKIGFSPDWNTRLYAKLVNYDDCSGNTLSLKAVINDAMTKNLDIKAKQHDLNAVLRDKHIAISQYFPGLNFNTGYSKLDEDRAKLPIGLYPEHSMNYKFTLKQVIFSDKLNANYDIKKSKTELTQAEKRELELNTASHAAITYISLLKLKSAVDIQKDFVDNTKSNLELAKARNVIGYSGPEDLYRWQSQIALNQRKLINAKAGLNAAKIALNNVLNRPQDDMFRLQEVELTDNVLITGKINILEHLDTPQKLNGFAGFLVKEALHNSPELKQLDKDIKIKKREMKSFFREFYVPEISIQGEFNHDYHRDFENSISPLLKDKTMQVGVYATLPVFNGGQKYFKYKKAKEELLELQTKREIAEKKLEELVRTHLEKAISSYFNINLTNKAKESAKKTFELVRNHYKTGTATIVELIDAQNNLLNAELKQRNTRYNFIIDLIWVQRAIGIVDFSRCDEKWDEWLDKLQVFIRPQKENIDNNGMIKL